jgi:hypothetical protein
MINQLTGPIPQYHSIMIPATRETRILAAGDLFHKLISRVFMPEFISLQAALNRFFHGSGQ